MPGYECPRELRTQSNGTIFVDDFAFSDQNCRKVKCPGKVPRAQDIQGSGAATSVPPVPLELCAGCQRDEAARRHVARAVRAGRVRPGEPAKLKSSGDGRAVGLWGRACSFWCQVNRECHDGAIVTVGGGCSDCPLGRYWLEPGATISACAWCPARATRHPGAASVSECVEPALRDAIEHVSGRRLHVELGGVEVGVLLESQLAVQRAAATSQKLNTSVKIISSAVQVPAARRSC